MTSNIGSQEILNGKSEDIDKILHSYFKPEFLNRIDEIVYFNFLNKDVQKQICQKMLNDFSLRLAEEYYKVVFDESVVNYVLDSAYDEEFGARPLRRFIQHNIETILAKMIINETIKVNTDYIVSYKNNELVINCAK